MKIIILSIKNSIRRTRFEYLNTGVSFYDAHVSDIDNVFDKGISKIIYGRNLSRGEVGCSISHYYILKKIYMQEGGWFIVLEDDAIVDNEDLLIEFYNNLPDTSKPTVYILGHSKADKQDLFIQKLKQPLYDSFNVGRFRCGTKKVNFFGTVGYAINKSAADLISKNEKVFWTADDWTKLAHMGIDIFHLEEPLIYEDYKIESTIGNKLASYHSFKKFPLSCSYHIFVARFKYLVYKLIGKKL